MCIDLAGNLCTLAAFQMSRRSQRPAPTEAEAGKLYNLIFLSSYSPNCGTRNTKLLILCNIQFGGRIV
jgi:hypothetical protein